MIRIVIAFWEYAEFMPIIMSIYRTIICVSHCIIAIIVDEKCRYASLNKFRTSLLRRFIQI